MLTPPTTQLLTPAQAAHAVHVFGTAVLISIGFVLVLAGMIIGPKRGRPRKPKVRPSVPLPSNATRKERYSAYLASAAWAHRKRWYYRWHPYRCRWPGCSVRVGLNLHHMRYERPSPILRIHRSILGREHLRELVSLCPDHHTGVGGIHALYFDLGYKAQRDFLKGKRTRERVAA